MRKVIAILLLSALLGGLTPVLAVDTPNPYPISVPGVEDPIGLQVGTLLSVGSSTPLSDMFSTDLWETNAANLDVRALLHGYETVAWTKTGGLVFNGTVVADAKVENSGGKQTCTITLQEGLTFSDGSPVTAQDYVFSLLLGASPALTEIGGATQGLGHLLGFDAYQRGQTQVFSGIRLLSDHRFAMCVPYDSSTYFYAMELFRVQPYPVSVIAPGCAVRDDGEGAYMTASSQAAAMPTEGLDYTPGVFSADMLRSTMLNPQTGYLYAPSVTSGPYAFEGFAPNTRTVLLAANHNFAGNYEGQRPHIERLVYTFVPEEDALAALSDGRIGLYNKTVGSDVIAACKTAAEAGALSMRDYPRNGLAFLALSCELGPTASVNLRQAMALSINKNALIERATANAATRVDGYYGMGQWISSYVDLAEDVPGKSPLSIPDTLPTLAKPADLARAKTLLAKDGWTLNAQGTAFVDGQDTVRYRSQNGVLESLTLQFAYTENDTLAQRVVDELTPMLGSLGIEPVFTTLPFPELLKHYYRQTDRTYHVMFLASNFAAAFDPFYTFHTDDRFQGVYNTSGLVDEALMRGARSLRATMPMDLRTYAERWLPFQERFNEMMPLVPLYSNTYYDFFRSDLSGYDPAGFSNWGEDILYAYLETAE